MGEKVLTVHGRGEHGHVVACAALGRGWMVRWTDGIDRTAPDPNAPFIIGIGHNAVRKQFDAPGMTKVVHSAACVDPSAVIAPGTFVGPMAVVHVGAKIGRGCIINTGAIVEHNCVVNSWAHISPGAVLCGNVEIGEGAWIGANAVVKQGLTIAPWVTVGCGAVVVKDITEPGTYIGVPAHKMN